MKKNKAIESLRFKYQALRLEFTERTRRIWAAAEAKSLGRGGPTIVHAATGISLPTIRRGMIEIESPETTLSPGRSRITGGGRKNITVSFPEISNRIDELVEPVTRGDPESPLRWTCKSIRRLSEELNNEGFSVSPTTIRMLLREQGYSLQANRKTREGIDNPDRNEQFVYINSKVKSFLRHKQPVISVDTKKKEILGNYSNKGKEYHKKKSPIETNTHDFPDKELGKAVPYGVYDIDSNEGWVNIGINHDTALFAVNSIRRWWEKMGRNRFPKATRLLITADAGGSNGYRTRLWKVALQTLASEIGLNITVCHFPPGTSKWNKIEHRLFSFISQNWRGKPLYNLETIINLIASTTTAKGLTVQCEIDRQEYKKGIVISDNDLSKIKINPHVFHGEWNYTIKR